MTRVPTLTGVTLQLLTAGGSAWHGGLLVAAPDAGAAVVEPAAHGRGVVLPLRRPRPGRAVVAPASSWTRTRASWVVRVRSLTCFPVTILTFSGRGAPTSGSSIVGTGTTGAPLAGASRAAAPAHGLFFGFGYYMYQEMEKMKGQSN